MNTHKALTTERTYMKIILACRSMTRLLINTLCLSATIGFGVRPQHTRIMVLCSQTAHLSGVYACPLTFLLEHSDWSPDPIARQ